MRCPLLRQPLQGLLSQAPDEPLQENKVPPVAQHKPRERGHPRRRMGLTPSAEHCAEPNLPISGLLRRIHRPRPSDADQQQEAH